MRPAAAAQSPRAVEAAALVSAALQRYGSAATYRLDFEQESYWALADSSTTARGTLTYKRPGRVSVRYDDGGRIVVTSDSLHVYAPTAGQFFASPVDSSDVAIDPARLLRAFTPDGAAPFAPVDPLSDGSRVVSLVPRSSHGEPARLEVTIDPGDATLSRIMAVSSSGDRTTYWIKSSSFGVSVADSEFVLRRPPGSQLLPGSPF